MLGSFLITLFGAGDGLQHAAVFALATGPDGLLYVGTEAGVERFDGQSFSPVPGPVGGGDPTVLALIWHEGALWAQSSSGVWRSKSGKVEFVSSGMVSSPVAGFSIGPEGSLWLANEAGVWTAGPDGLVEVWPDVPWRPTAVLPDANGAWVGSVEGLWRVDKGKEPERRSAESVRALLEVVGRVVVGREDGIFYDDGTPVGAPACYVTGLASLPDERLVASCGDGARLQMAEGWEILNEGNGLPGPVARDVLVDAEGNLWFAAWRRGLARLTEPGLRLWGDEQHQIAPLVDLVVREGELLLSGFGGARIVAPDRTVRTLPPIEPGNDFLWLDKDATGAPVASTRTAIWTLRNDRWEVSSELRFSSAPTRDSENRLWTQDAKDLVTHDGALRWPLPADVVVPSPRPARAGGVYLLGVTLLWRLDETGAHEVVDTPPDCGSNGVVEDVGTDLWVACGSGAWKRMGEAWVRSNSLAPGEAVLADLVRGESLWVATRTRLVRISPDPWVFDLPKFLPNAGFLSNRMLAHFGDWMVANTSDGVLWIDPASLDRPRPVPTAIVRGVESRGRPLLPPYRLGEEDGWMRVLLGAGRLGDPVLSRWRWRLDGGAWSESIGDGVATVADIASGEHRFEAQASVVGGAWSEVAALDLSRATPWHRRVELHVALGLTAVAVAGAVWRDRRARRWRDQEHRREQDRLMRIFGLYVSPAVAEQAMRGTLSTRGELCEVTVLFFDLRDFTAMSETMEPHALVEVLNVWLGAMVPLVEEEGGIVNKFVGDSVVAIFGAPIERADHAERGVRAAVRMARATEAVGRRFGRTIAGSAGLNTGRVVAGPIGADSRKEYTVIGDTVNVAARVEGLTRSLGATVLITDATARGLSDRSGLEDAGQHRVKGVSSLVQVWRVA